MQQYAAEFRTLTTAIEAHYANDNGGGGDPLEQLLEYEELFETSAFTAEVAQYIAAQ